MSTCRDRQTVHRLLLWDYAVRLNIVRRRGDELKFEPRRLAEYTDEALLAEIRRVAKIVSGPILSVAAFTKHARVGRTTLRRRFGGWREALDAAGLGHLYKEVPPVRISRTRARGWTTDQVVQELRRVAAVLGRQSLTVDEFKMHATVGPDGFAPGSVGGHRHSEQLDSNPSTTASATATRSASRTSWQCGRTMAGHPSIRR